MAVPLASGRERKTLCCTRSMTANSSSAPARVAFLFAQEKGKGCGGGGRCWAGDAGKWREGDDPKKPEVSFARLDIPDGQQGVYTHAFKC